jgi:hypothetical protein
MEWSGSFTRPGRKPEGKHSRFLDWQAIAFSQARRAGEKNSTAKLITRAYRQFLP